MKLVLYYLQIICQTRISLKNVLHFRNCLNDFTFIIPCKMERKRKHSTCSSILCFRPCKHIYRFVHRGTYITNYIKADMTLNICGYFKYWSFFCKCILRGHFTCPWVISNQPITRESLAKKRNRYISSSVSLDGGGLVIAYCK